MNKPRALMIVLLCLLCSIASTSALGQVINATLSGTVADTTGALIPGVEVSATQTQTGVMRTSITNESGTYRFGALQPGPYEVSASLPGFQTQTFRLTLGTAQQIRRNFTLQVGTVATAVEVNVAADELLTAVSSSVGTVLPQTQVTDLPLVGRNVVNFATMLPGVQGNGNSGTTFAGIAAGGSANVNLQLDGMTVNNGRHTMGLTTATSINPDMVDEFRVVMAAVDVEGRGSAQIQVRTKSGTNQFHGGATWNVRNSALDANSWSNNRQAIDKTWFNRHQYTATIGGPIVRNKTFFFGMFDGQRGLQKETVDATVLTPAARQGIFRFFPGVNNGPAEYTRSGSGNTLTVPVVDLAGNPLDWTQVQGATGPMKSFNVFGDALNPGDPNRTAVDASGFMQKLISLMPMPNAYNGTGTDGLNTATHRWVRRRISGLNYFSGGEAFDRTQFHVKIDHNFSPNHTLTGSYAREHQYSDNNALSPWPNGWGGEVTEDPRVISLNLTSTLAPTVLNEFRYGRRMTTLRSTPAYNHSKHGAEAWAFMTQINDTPVMQHPTLFQDHIIACAGYCADFGNRSPLSTFSDSLSWTRGAHALKFGAEFRFAQTFGWSPNVVIPHAYGGAGDVPVKGIDTIASLLPANVTLAQNLLLSLSGSVNDTRQRFEIREPGQTDRFLDYRDTYFSPDNPEDTYGRIRDWRQNEFNFFVKDDWKVTPSFTLNLGLRYDLMRVPYMLSAAGKTFTPSLKGGGSSIFGYSGRDFSGWMSGGTPRVDEDTQTVLVGKGTDYPNQGIWPSDKNNFAPAVGFAWSPNWGGQDRTTIRGGYQIAYQLPGNSLSWIDVDAGNLPGFFYEPTDFGDGSYRDFSNMAIPLPVTQKPFEPIPITERAQLVRTYAGDYTTPYVQTFTLGMTRYLASNLTLDVKYVGTRGIRLHSTLELNSPDIRNNGVLQALEITRAGGDAELFNRMMGGLNIGSGVIGTNISGSEALRRHASFRTNIANGDFVAVASLLNRTNLGTNPPPLTNGGLLRSSGLFPENFFVVNPQFSQIQYRDNSDSSNYHSLQTQVTLRPTHGVTYQATYTLSRSLGIFGGYRDLMNQRADYTLQGTHRTHDFRSYGTFALPFGPGRLLGGNSSGVLARLIEGWQFGTILNISSGVPLNVSGRNTLYAAGTPDVARTFSRDGQVEWGELFGNFFAEGYTRVPDPGCGAIAANLQRWCTNTALTDANGNIVLQNAAPGQLGSLGLRPIEGPGTWDFDANIQKRIQIDESKRLTFRVDASNILNHPTPGSPALNINSGTFGEIRTKNGNRTLQAQLRLEF